MLVKAFLDKSQMPMHRKDSQPPAVEQILVIRFTHIFEGLK